MENRYLKIIIIVLTGLFSTLQAQVGVGNITPASTLDITAADPTGAATTVDGILIPRVDRQRAQGMVATPTSTLIYVNSIATGTATGTAVNITVVGFYFFDGTAWQKIQTGAASTDWTTLGNSGTVAATNFVGTTDAIDFVTRTNNTEKTRVTSAGNMGIGTAVPAAKLDIAAATTTNTNIVNATGSINDYLQFNIQNTSTGIQAQSGYNATADNGTATTGFVWLGINNSTFNFPTAYNIGLANDVSYIASGQDMYIANANNTKSIIFSTGRAATPFFNERMRLTNAGNLGIGSTSPSNRLHIVNDADGQGVLRVDNGTAGGFSGLYFYQGANYRGHIGYVNTGGVSTFGGKGYYQLAAGDRPMIFSTNSGAETYQERMIIAQDGRVGINTNPTNLSTTIQPTSTLQVNGSFAIKTAFVGSTSTLASDVCKVFLNNAGTNITITLPDPATCTGRLISFTRFGSSTGTVTLTPSVGNIQDLNGAIVASTTIGIHSATGGGVNIQFWSSGSTWYR